MSLAKIEARAAAACRHPDLAWVMKYIPKQYRDNPAVIASFLTTAANGDPSFADDPAYHAAHASLVELRETRDLRDTVARLYHDPKVQLAAGDRGIDWYLQRPAAIREALRDPKIAAQLGTNLTHQIGVVAVESQLFAEANGIAEPAVAEVPIPSDAGRAESELAALRTKSVNGTLTKAEDARLAALYEARIAREDTGAAAEIAAHAKALGMRDRPAGAYQALIEKSVTGKLTPEEDARLTEMSGERAVQQGLIDASDLDAEQE